MQVSFVAFRDRHPDAQIISDLLQVERDRFVVKVTITTASSGVASGLAAHTAIEVAEDQARLRAMAALGFASAEPVVAASPSDPQPATPPPPPKSVAESAPLQSAIAAPLPTSPAAATPLQTPSTNSANPVNTPTPPSQTHKPKPSPPKSAKVVTTPQKVEKIRSQPDAIESPVSFDSDDINLDGDDFDETNAPTEAPLLAAAPQAESAVAPIAAEALPAPINLSDVIAQTDIELRRLGWSVEAGREYLEQTYQKRSRHELSEEELIQFLCHLESL